MAARSLQHLVLQGVPLEHGQVLQLDQQAELELTNPCILLKDNEHVEALEHPFNKLNEAAFNDIPSYVEVLLWFSDARFDTVGSAEANFKDKKDVWNN